MKFGIATQFTETSPSPTEIARWAEAEGFESLWVGEHTHVAAEPDNAPPIAMPFPEFYRRMFDPFVALSAAGAVTTTLKLGTGVCVVPYHEPIALAKAIGTLDHMTGGRFIFGVGAGWNALELANHGVEFEDRWKVLQERVAAMREIWTREKAEYHGKFVNFDPLYCWPKPPPGRPKVLLGAWSKFVPKRVAEWGDGWLAVAGLPDTDLAAALGLLRKAAAEAGRSMDDIDLSVIVAAETAGSQPAPLLQELAGMGFGRILLSLTPDVPERMWPVLHRYAELKSQFGEGAAR